MLHEPTTIPFLLVTFTGPVLNGFIPAGIIVLMTSPATKLAELSTDQLYLKLNWS